MELNPADLKVFLNHIYEFKKGVRRMVLYTTNKKYEDFAVKRLANQRIKFIVQQVDDERINLFFGCDECIDAGIATENSERWYRKCEDCKVLDYIEIN